MEDFNEDDLIMSEQSKEIKETIWKIWDLLNDKELVTKLLINSPLINELQNAYSLILNSKDNKTLNRTDNSVSTRDKEKSEQNSKY